MKILVIGGGNMGTAYARSFLRAHVIKPEELMILENSPEKAFQLRQEGLGTISANPEDCLPEADLVILAVKPQDFVSVMSLYPVKMMFIATKIAIIGSIINKPVNFTIIIPAITPTEVHTSVIRCFPSASKTTDFLFLPFFIRICPTNRFTKEANSENNKPVLMFSSGFGSIIRGIADQIMLKAATRINAPSTALEKYSALL